MDWLLVIVIVLLAFIAMRLNSIVEILADIRARTPLPPERDDDDITDYMGKPRRDPNAIPGSFYSRRNP